MKSILKIALRNLIRYKRRTMLTSSLITVGVVFVVVYVAVSSSFKNLIVGQITDSMLGHAQIHSKGYVASIENLPLNTMITAEDYQKIQGILDNQALVESYAPRLKFGGMFSNYAETTNIRLNGIYPDQEYKTLPLFTNRVISGSPALNRGEIFVPQLLADGMNVKVGDSVVIVATNHDGSVNGMPFNVSAVLESVVGPGGRDGYIHFEDAQELLRMDQMQISEVVIRLSDFNQLKSYDKSVQKSLKKFSNNGQPVFEAHTWEGLSPFANIAKMINVMTLFIKIMLVAIVLIGIMNVMMMAVYERIKEIGTIAAIGTLPEKILSMYVAEGFLLGLVGSFVGIVIGALVIAILNAAQVTFNFGMQKGLVLEAHLSLPDSLAITATVLFVSLAASLYPAFKASRMEPVDALRHV